MIAFALVAAATLLGLVLLRPGGGSALFGPTALFIAPPLGLLCIGLFVAIAWTLGAPPETSLPPIVVLIAAVWAVDWWRDPPRRWLSGHEGGVGDASHWWGALSWIIAAAYLAAPLYACIWMGSGASPPVFFNVDLPYYLTQTHALVRSETYPPPSLNTLGVAVPYHYGIQLVAALPARAGGIPAHAAFFWIVMPALLVGVVALAWRIATLASRQGMPHWLALLLLLALSWRPLYALDKALTGWLTNGDVVTPVLGAFDSAGMPSAGTLAGLFITLAAGLLMADTSIRNRLPALAILVGSLALFKSPYIVPVGLWLGAWSLYVLFSERRFGPFIAAACAFFLALWFSLYAQRPTYALELALDFWRHDPDWIEGIARATVQYGLVLLFAAGCMLIARSRPNRPSDASALIAVCVSGLVLCLPVIVYATYVTVDGDRSAHTETRQWLTPLITILAIAVVGFASGRWGGLNWARRTAFAAAVIGVGLAPIVSRVLDLHTLLVSPERWHDFADNRKIAPALAVVPIEGSVIATNDLFYPADNYHRDRRQFQVAALFGHQAYGAAVFYDRPDDATQRTAAQQRLASAVWNEELTRIACNEGWTHILLSKRIDHPETVPGTLLFENDAYLTYRIDWSAAACTAENPESDLRTPGR